MGVKISYLPLKSPLSGTEELEINDGFESKKVTAEGIADLANIKKLSQTTTSGIILLDAQNWHEVIITGITDIDSNRSIGIQNGANLVRFTFIFSVVNTTPDVRIKLQSNFLFMSDDPYFDKGTRMWTPEVYGKFKMTGVFDGTYWLIDISKANYI